MISGHYHSSGQTQFKWTYNTMLLNMLLIKGPSLLIHGIIT